MFLDAFVLKTIPKLVLKKFKVKGTYGILEFGTNCSNSEESDVAKIQQTEIDDYLKRNKIQSKNGWNLKTLNKTKLCTNLNDNIFLNKSNGI